MNDFKFKKIISCCLSLIIMCSFLCVPTFVMAEGNDAEAVEITINDISDNVVTITADADKEATVILASYKNNKLVNVSFERLVDDKKITAGTNNYTLEGFVAGDSDTIRAYVWEDIDGTLYPICKPYSESSLSATGSVTIDEALYQNGAVIQAGNSISAEVPKDVSIEENATQLTLNVETKNESESNLTIGENENLKALDVHIDGISKNNTAPIVVNLGSVLEPNMNAGAIKLYHIENGVSNEMTYVSSEVDFSAHNQFKYDPATGALTICVISFSEFAVLTDTTNTWSGLEDISWYVGKENDAEYTLYNVDQLAGLGKLVRGYTENETEIEGINFAGKTIKLGADIKFYNINESGEYLVNEHYFFPIGDYYNPFSGTFDGMGHTVSNLHQNGWDMGYYDLNLGLFGCVENATVQNLTIDSFKLIMELCDVGCVTGYAGGTSKFKNIAVFNSDASSYNKRVAGIVGSNPSRDDGANLTFENITVDESNTFHSLWGTWDCATSAILGKLETNSKANLINCHASATLDVYNDVCANYQYYWYRYCGMLIGTVNKTKTENGYQTLDLSNITAENCTVNFGDRHEYYYCEFEENTVGSYCGPHDYQMSRVPNDEIDTSVSPAVCIGHDHTDGEDRTAVYLPFKQVFGGYGWGVKGTQIDELEGIKDITPSEYSSEVKFAGNYANYSHIANKQYTVGELFGAAQSLDNEGRIADESVMVSVTSVESGMDVGTYTANTNDWTLGTITFEENFTGLVKLTIQDYQYCKPTTLYLNVEENENSEAINEFIKLHTDIVLIGRASFNDFLSKVAN